MVRPELVRLSVGEGAEGIEGEVEETVFIGTAWKTWVRVAGGSRVMALEPPAAHGAVAGTRVRLAWDAERAVLLPGES